MNTPVRKCLLFVFALHVGNVVLAAASALTTRLDDPMAVYLEAPAFDVHGDSATEDSAAIQKAIDKAASSL